MLFKRESLNYTTNDRENSNVQEEPERKQESSVCKFSQHSYHLSRIAATIKRYHDFHEDKFTKNIVKYLEKYEKNIKESCAYLYS